ASPRPGSSSPSLHDALPIYVARLLEALHADQAWAGRKGDRLGELDVGDPSVALQVREDVDVDAVQLDGLGHPASLGSMRGSGRRDRKSTRLNSSHLGSSYAV